MKHSNNRLEVRVQKFINSTTAAQLRWYHGVVIPAIIEQVKESQGEEFERDEIDLINKQHANSGKFKTAIVGGQSVVMFKEPHVSKMNKDQFQRFIENVIYYWGGRGIIIPEPKNVKDEKLDKLFRSISERQA
jgi:hypothetical protein